ncbi:MAG: PEP-utilizing enzyme [Candidatus Paceibacterota bacterium]|jgi:phosphoenolpyruvate synthase/pyruvate phosphate dikinase
MKEKLYKYEVPTHTYFYSPVPLEATLKEMGHPILGEYYGHMAHKDKGLSMVVIRNSTYNEAGSFFLKLLDENNQEFTDRLYSLVKQISVLGDSLQNRFKDDLINNRVSHINDFYDDYTKIFTPLIGLGYTFDYAIDQYLKENNIEPSSIRHFGNSFLTVEKNKLKKIFEINNETERNAALKDHANSYGWLLNNYVGENRLSVDYFLNRKDEVSQAELFNDSTDDHHKPENLMEWFSLLIYVRDERKRVNLIAIGLMDRYLKSECEHLNLNYNDAVLCTVEEFEMLKNQAIPKRNERYLKFTFNGPREISKTEWDDLLNSGIESLGNIKGSIACKGIAKGKVKIIMSTSDFSKVEQGDVIVASMTRPDFAPILGKCSAIVTNEGGITCHAAIVSRELKIPCIIGTMDATKRLKDGDMVEVDADNGIVKILA